MRMLFGTLQVYMLLVYFKRNQPVDSSGDLFIPYQLKGHQQPLSPGHVNSLTHHPQKRSPCLQHCQEGEISYVCFFRDADSPKYSTPRNVKLPEFFWCDLRSSKRGWEISGWIYHHPPPKRSRIPGWLEKWRFRYKCDVILVGGGIFWNYPPT